MTGTSPTKRACDQCHTVKEKCRRAGLDVTCERCSRLKQNCQTSRRAAKTGRKPRSLQKLSYTLPNSQKALTHCDYMTPSSCSSSSLSAYNGGLATNSAVLPHLDDWERHFLNLMKDILAPSPLDKYLIGPSFHISHHVSFVQNFLKSTPALKHAGVACAAILFGEDNEEYAKAGVEIGHRRAALAVSSLRSFKILNEHDLATVIVLGVAMITFALHVAEGQPCLISHYTLSLVKPQIHTVYSLDPVLVDYLMCLVSTETLECLFKCELPSLRIDPNRRTHIIDRYLGISSSIFALLYDICEVAKLLKHASVATAAKAVEQLISIRIAVKQWQPSPPKDFCKEYTQAEVISMLSQAKVFRLTALLIIHRLQFLYGEQDQEALALSNAIITEFDMVLQFTQRSIPCTTLPYLAACAEVMEPSSRSRALEKGKIIVNFSKHLRIRFETLAASIWKARDSGYRFHWFELGDITYLGAKGGDSPGYALSMG